MKQEIAFYTACRNGEGQFSGKALKVLCLKQIMGIKNENI